jgi:hypothetical protein
MTTPDKDGWIKHKRGDARMPVAPDTWESPRGRKTLDDHREAAAEKEADNG